MGFERIGAVEEGGVDRAVTKQGTVLVLGLARVSRRSGSCFGGCLVSPLKLSLACGYSR